MAVLEKIVVSDYRNIEFQEMEFSPNINCISGNNGEGKTNLLDAIYYLSMTKSAFTSSDKYNFRHGCNEFSLCGTYSMHNSTKAKFSIHVTSKGEKKLKRDDKAYPRISGHIGELPVVMVSPSDTSLVSDTGEERRRFANSVLSQMDNEYLSAAQQYNKLLLHRNSMLKNHVRDKELLAVFDLKMQEHAAKIYNARKSFAKLLQPAVSHYYNSLSGCSESVDIQYRSDLDKGNLADILQTTFEKDSILGYTTAGIQRDDFIFTMDGHPIRRCGSQGQQKSFLVSLKFAQYEIMKDRYGFPPMLLLDDVFDKLDMNRISHLLEMVAGQGFGQIFITDSNKVRLSGIVDGITSDRSYFETVNGHFTKL